MLYMQAHNCKLHYNDCSASARRRCQSKYFWNKEAVAEYIIFCHFLGINILPNQLVTFSLLAIHDSDREEFWKKVKLATFFLCGEQGMKEQEGRGGSRMDRESVVEPKNEEFQNLET